jgi:hypothetical protein
MGKPKGRPDLKLAESYIPAVACTAKGLLYACIGLLTQIGNEELRLLCVTAVCLTLYYDHIYLVPGSKYIDTTAICTDVLAATLLCTFLSIEEAVAPGNIAACTAWAVAGVAHLLFSKQHTLPVPVAHCTTCAFLLFVVAVSPKAQQEQQQQGYIALARALVYVLLVLVDAYVLKPPWQKESDRVHSLRYGALLFVHWYALVWLAIAMGAAQAARALYYNQSPSEDKAAAAAEPPQQPQGLSTADMEAFHRAREQYNMSRGNASAV